MAASTLTASPAQIAAATPLDRDRYLDLLRAVALAAVVVGHWLVAMVWIDDDGALRAAAVIDVAPVTRWLTWIVQVMPLFFLVGGVVNVRSWRAARRARGSYAGWVARRAARLLRPTTVVVWTWLGLAPLALAAGVERRLIVLGARSALVPLWFLGVYLLIIALLPLLLAAWGRLGLWLPLLLTAAAAGVDAGALAAVPALTVVNYLIVWSVPTVLGFAWTDGRLDGRAVRIGCPWLRWPPWPPPSRGLATPSAWWGWQRRTPVAPTCPASRWRCWAACRRGSRWRSARGSRHGCAVRGLGRWSSARTASP